ncbi:MAG: hypothetical protein ABID61_01105 [Candidatus Micrarchaeota archaeon]
MNVETQLKAEIAKYDPARDIKYVPRAVARVEEIIAFIDHSDVEIRRYVSAGAIYALMGNLPRETSERLLAKLAERLILRFNGHAEPVEPDVYVRERCANAFEMAASTAKTVTPHLETLKLSRDKDPHEWVRDRARDAIRYLGSLSDTKKIPNRPVERASTRREATI